MIKLDLPINQKKSKIINYIKNHQILIIEGETGSGKTTQVPKFAVLAGRGINKRIVCTQPKRIAAISVASYISEEMESCIGNFVGYKIRFKEQVSEHTRIKIVTDGIFLREFQLDPTLSEYDTIIVDEAHERSLNIDLILGVLKRLLILRKDLKLIIMSATLDIDKFSDFFKDAPIISIPGRLYSVKTLYLPEKNKTESYIKIVVETINKILSNKNCYGDILVFVPTEYDVHEICKIINKKYKKTKVLPLFARLGSIEQKKIFYNYSDRKIVVTTNIAETSITVPGIKYVIDTGLARISKYLPQSGITTLPILPISKSSADQRKGRCGRVEKGICIRLYKKSDYLERSLFTEPEILRSNLSEVILRMLSFNIVDIFKFPFIDCPPDRNFYDGLKLLLQLGAITEKKEISDKPNKYKLTINGEKMSKLPIDPRLSRVLIEALKQNCLEEALIVVSALSVGNPTDNQFNVQNYQTVALKHKLFKSNISDFITLLNIWNIIHGNSLKIKYLGSNKIKKVCKQYSLSFIRVKEWINTYIQIKRIIKEQKIFKTKKTPKAYEISSKENLKEYKKALLYKSLHKSIIAGFLSNIAIKKNKRFFVGQKEHSILIFPGSSVSRKRIDTWIIATQFVRTSYLFARNVALINPNWIETVSSFLCKYSWKNPHWEKGEEKVIAYEQVSLFGLTIIKNRKVFYGKINSNLATKIFIKEVLINYRVKDILPFMKFNKDLITSVKNLEQKLRKKNILVDEETIINFYIKKIKEVYDMKTLKNAIKKRGSDLYLRMTVLDICNYLPIQEKIEQFPDKIWLGNKYFNCSYVFDPSKNEDGVTVSIPHNFDNSIEQCRISWLIPGLFTEKITTLLKGLDKEYRKQLIPIHKNVDLIIGELPKYNKNISSALSDFLFKKLNIKIPPIDWQHDNLPNYLKMRIAIKDDKGKTIISTRNDSILLKNTLKYKPLDILPKTKKIWEINNIIKWNFGDLPKKILSKNKTNEICSFFPRLKLNSSNIDIRVFSNLDLARKEHTKGVAKLLCNYFSKELKLIKKSIKMPVKYKKESKYFGGLHLIESQIYSNLLKDFFLTDEILTAHKFQEYVSLLKDKNLSIIAELRAYQVLNLIKLFIKILKLVITIKRNALSNSSLIIFANIIKQELFKILPPNFILLYDYKKLKDITRYVSAINIRAIRGVENLKRDKNRRQLIIPHILSLEKILTTIDFKTSNAKRLAIEEYFWMIEEYKISIFSQEIKTTGSISDKRLNKFLEKIKMML